MAPWQCWTQDGSDTKIVCEFRFFRGGYDFLWKGGNLAFEKRYDYYCNEDWSTSRSAACVANKHNSQYDHHCPACQGTWKNIQKKPILVRIGVSNSVDFQGHASTDNAQTLSQAVSASCRVSLSSRAEQDYGIRWMLVFFSLKKHPHYNGKNWNLFIQLQQDSSFFYQGANFVPKKSHVGLSTDRMDGHQA